MYIVENEILLARLKTPYKPTHYSVPVRQIDLEIDRSHLTLTTKIGNGAFGEVWQAKYKSRSVAAKVLKGADGVGASPPPHASKSIKEMFLEEAMTLARLEHPKIVHIFGICAECEPFFLVTEYMPNGDLRNYLMRMGPDQVSFQNLIDILTQVTFLRFTLTGSVHVHYILKGTCPCNYLICRSQRECHIWNQTTLFIATLEQQIFWLVT